MGKRRITNVAREITTANISTGRNFYGLFIGIDTYVNPQGVDYYIPPLSGCVHDVTVLREYFEQLSNFSFDNKILTNQEATKAGIVNAFYTHFINKAASAKPDDVFYLHFSGHGCREMADSVWINDINGKFESIVCYNNSKYITKCLLADKELRFLIGELHAKNPKIHIVTSFDCCHSGGNTSDIGTGILTMSTPKERQVSTILPMRSWSDFIFVERKNISKEDIQRDGIKHWLPAGNHVQLAACQENESAFEELRADGGGNEGVFTKNLIELLRRSSNRITYYDLKRRIRNYIKYQHPQTPQLYIQGETNQDIFRFFLGKSDDIGASSLSTGQIYRKGRTNSWVMDMGKVHGINETTVINIEVDWPLHHMPVGTAAVESLTLTETVLSNSFSGSFRTPYKGLINDVAQMPLSVYIRNEDGDENAEGMLIKYFYYEKYLSITSNRNLANYEILIKQGKLSILPRQMSIDLEETEEDIARKQKLNGTPLVATLQANDYYNAIEFFKQISNWEYLRELSNATPTAFTQKKPLEIRFYEQGGVTSSLDLNRDTLNLPIRNIEGQWKSDVSIELTNKHDGDIYISLLLMDNIFGVHNLFAGSRDTITIAGYTYQEPVLIESGRSKNVPLSLNLKKATTNYGIPKEVHYLKIIVATKDFRDIVAFTELLHTIPLLEYGLEYMGTLADTDRGLELPPATTLQAWTTFTIKLQMENPDWREN